MREAAFRKECRFFGALRQVSGSGRVKLCLTQKENKCIINRRTVAETIQKEESMKIAGLQKMTLLDYPGKVACTVFLQGCNFRCPFCHNSDLLGAGDDAFMTQDALIAFLSKRTGLLDAVCISGGEPTLNRELPELIRAIKALGYSVKLDTNGSRPQVVKGLVDEGLLDYVAMDVKNDRSCYGETIGIADPDLEKIEESIRFLESGAVDHEFRTTVVKELHGEAALQDMGRWIASLSPTGRVKRLFLQPFVDRDSVLFSGLNPPDDEEMAKYMECLRPFTEYIAVRG